MIYNAIYFNVTTDTRAQPEMHFTSLKANHLGIDLLTSLLPLAPFPSVLGVHWAKTTGQEARHML